MSEIIILNGCIDMFDDKSMNKMAMAPNHKAVDVLKPNEPAFGNKAMTTMATKAPKIKYGKRRPILGNQVRSEK